jgi:hypothetical protein
MLWRIGLFSIVTVADLMMVIGQTDITSLSGGAGWVGAGLLGSVLGWLLIIHLPAKDKQIKEFVDNSNVRMDTVIKSYREDINQQRGDFAESLTKVISHCDNEAKQLRDNLIREVEVRIKDVITVINRDTRNRDEKS